MSKEKELKPIPGASKYAMDEEGNVMNVISKAPVFPKEGKVRIYIDGPKSDRRIFDVEKLKTILFGESKPAAKKETEKKAEKKEVKKSPEKKVGQVKEVRALLDKGKSREEIEALGKYNPNTIRAQFYFKRAEDAKK